MARKAFHNSLHGVANEKLEARWQRADAEVKKNLPQGAKLMQTLRGHVKWIGRIAWSPDGRLLASPSEDKTIRLWDTATGECLQVLKGTHSFASVAFETNAGNLISGDSGGNIKFWKTDSGELLESFKSQNSDIWDVSFGPVVNCIATGGSSRRSNDLIELWDATSGKFLKKFDKHQNTVCSVAFSFTGKELVSCDQDRRIILWDLESGDLRRFKGHKGMVLSVAFSPSGHQIASGSEDTTIKLWDVKSGVSYLTLEGHSGDVKCVAFSPDGRYLASKGKDSIRIWSVDTGQCIGTILDPAAKCLISSLAFHPDQPLLAAVGSDPGALMDEKDQIIHIYQLDFGLLLSQAATKSVSYSSAKVVLVGDSNVGKSYLAHRIATGMSPEEGTIKSTHGIKFWPLEPERLSLLAKAPVGQRRDVVLWDMGGQDEYRLVHQLFLHDTTLALVLFDPTRGASALKDVETWNKSLENQLQGRAAVKLLVGAKLDEPSDTIDHHGVRRLITTCGFAGYYETSAITGRGIVALCDAMAKTIDWCGLGRTSRPELFQAIRDEIEIRRSNGVVVVLFDDLDQELLGDDESEAFTLLTHAISMASDAKAGTETVNAVCSQLAQQGIIARAKTSSGKDAIILRIEEVERYAGSLIIAARKNPRGVPALELRAIAREKFILPGIAETERLRREQEKHVIECTVQLLLEHGICFQHEGLLIFPSLFVPVGEESDSKFLHSVSLYYDFAGAIDNIYASLVAWLVLAKEFGKVRLWADRAEFEVKEGGLCGLRKVGRAGGFAHVDVYFEAETPQRKRRDFISFVEDHLTRNGVEIHEHVAIKCLCNHEFTEETLRLRIARGDKDVGCPVCENRHSLTEGAAESRRHDPKISRHTWALRTRIEKSREKISKRVVKALGGTSDLQPAMGPLRVLHLSDLHFTVATPVGARLQWLLDDIKQDSGLSFKKLDYLVISGDFTDKGSLDGFEKAYDFVAGLIREFNLSAERCIFVPGNHDLRDLRESYDWRENAKGLKEGEWVRKEDIIFGEKSRKISS